MTESVENPAIPEEEEEGAPGWVMTFADLMSLLMCFFVLLLSFSEIEAKKFKQMAGSMRMAFGVQREVEAAQTPKGTSVIAQEFSPGKPEPTALDQVRQATQEEQAELARNRERLLEDAERLERELREQIDSGLVDIETEEGRIIIRIQEKGSFPSGSADLNRSFVPVMETIRDKIRKLDGRITVVGHTDDVPINSRRFRSNWDLSAARAASVMHHLQSGDLLDEGRLELKGLADTQPLVSNDTPANRARNRRVEIIIHRSDA